MIEKELLWEELGLDSLLTYEQSFENKLDKKLLKNKPASVVNHQKMIKKPTYSAVMNRYNSMPHKPKTITKSKLDELADPVMGKLTKNERLKLEKYNGKIMGPRYSSNQTESGDEDMDEDQAIDFRSRSSLNNDHRGYNSSNSPSPTKSVNPLTQIQAIKNLHNQVVSSQHLHEEIYQLSPIVEESSQHKDNASLFLTEMEESGNYNKLFSKTPSHQNHNQNNIIESNIQHSKNSFAGLLRDRIQNAQKLNKLLQPIELKEGEGNQSPIKGQHQQQQLNRQSSSNTNLAGANQRQRKANLKQQIVNHRKPAGNTKSSKPGGPFGKNYFQKNNKISDQDEDNASVHSKDNFRDPLTQKPKKIRSSGYAVEVKRYSNQPRPMMVKKKKEVPPPPPKARRKYEPPSTTFLTGGGGGETTDDENSVQRQPIARKRNNYPVRASNANIRQSQSQKALNVSSSNSILNRRRGPSVERGNKIDGQNKGIIKRSSMSSLPNRNSKQMKSQDSLLQNTNNTDPSTKNSNIRNYGIKRSSASVPALLRQKVQSTRSQPDIEINGEIHIRENNPIQSSDAQPSQEQSEFPSVDPVDPLQPEDLKKENISELITKLTTFEQQEKKKNKPVVKSQRPSEERVQDQQMTSLLKKHAEKLNSYFSNAEKKLNNYSELKDLN
jgi:hypothetical protein